MVGLITGGILLLGSNSEAQRDQTASWQPELRAGTDGAWLGVSQTW